MLSSIAFETVKSWTDNKKARFWKNVLNFQIFQTSGNLEIDFGIGLENVFDKLSILLELHCFFVEILTCSEKDLKHIHPLFISNVSEIWLAEIVSDSENWRYKKINTTRTKTHITKL